MLEGVVADVLARVLGQYVLGIDRDSVRVGVWSGQLELGRLALRAEALATLFESLGLDLPVVVSSGTLQSLSVDVPWKRLGSEPVKVSVRSLALVAAPVIAAATGPAAATADARAERETRLKRATLSADDAVREAKWSVGADPTATAAGGAAAQASSSAAAPGAPGAKAGGRGRWGSSLWGWRFTSRIVARIVDNIQVDLQDVTVRYEDAASVPSAPFALHASLGALRACSTDSSWSEVFLQDPLSPVVHKRIALSKLSVAWVPLEACSSEVDDQDAVGSEDAGESEDAGGSASSADLSHPTPPSEADERETPVEPPQHYLVQPVSAEMRVAITKAWAVGRALDDTNGESGGAPGGGRAKSGRARQARVSLDVRCSSVGLTLAGEQYSTLLRAVLALSDLERRSPPRTPRERWAWAVERLLPRFRQRRAAAARFNEAGLRDWRLQRERYVDARVRLVHARRVANEEEDPADRELVERIETDLDARDIVFFRDLADEAAAKAAASATAAAEPIASATSRLWSVFSRARSTAAPPADPAVVLSAAASTGDDYGGLALSAGEEVDARDEDASPSRPNEDALPIVIPEPPDGSVSRSTSAAALGDVDSLSHDDPGDGDGPWNGGESAADAVVTPNLRVVFGLQRGSLRLQRYGAVADPLADIIFRDLRVELETRPGAGLLLEALLGTFEVWDAQCNAKVVYPRVPWAPQGVAGEVDTVSARREGLSAQRPPTMCTADGRGVSPDVDDVDGSPLEHHLMDSEAYGAVDVFDALRAIRGGLHPSELLATGWQQSSSPPSSVAGVTTGGGGGSVDSSAYTSSSPARAEDLTDDDIKARPLRHIAAMRLSRDAGADANVLSGSTRLALELAVGGVEMLLSGGPEGALAGVATFFSPRHTSPSVMAFLSAAAAPRLAAIRMEVQRALLERSVPPRLDVVIRGPRLLVPGPAAADPAAVVDLGTFAMDTAPPAELPPLSLQAALSARSISPATRSRRPLSTSRLGGAAREAGPSDIDARDLLQKHSRPAQGSRGRSVDSDRLDGLGRPDAKAVEFTDYRVAVSDLGIFLVPSLSQLSRAQRLVRPFSVHLRLHVLHNASFVEATAAEGQRSALARLRLRGRVPALRVYLSHGAYRQLLTIARGWKAVLASAGVSPADGVGGDGDSEDSLAESTSDDGGEAATAPAEAASVPERIQQLDVELALGDASLELRERTGRRLITVEAAGSRLQAVRGRSGFSLRYALRSLTVTDGSRGGTAPFRRLVHAGVGNSHRGVSPPRSLPAFLGSPGASLVPTPVEGLTRASSYNSLAGVEAGEAAASSTALSGQAGVAADGVTDAAGGISGRLPPWPRGVLSSTLRSPSGEALVGPGTEPDRDFIKVVYSLDTSRREQSLKVRILSLHVVCVRETYLSVVKFFYLFDETPPTPVSHGVPDAGGQAADGGSAQYSDPFAAVGTTTSAAARRLAAKAERGLERGAANLARRGRLRLDAKLDGVSVDLISAEGALASLDVFSFRAGLRLDPSGAVAARGALAGFTVRDLTAAFPGHSSTVVYERLSPHRDSGGRLSGEGDGDGDVPDGFVCDNVDPHDVAGDAEDAEDGFTLIVPPTAKGGDVWLRARMTNLRIVYLQRFVFIVNTYFAVLREGLAPVLQMQGGLSEIFDSSEPSAPAGGAAPDAGGGSEATALAGDGPAAEEGAPARAVKPHPRKRERRRLRLHVVTKGVDIVIPRHSQNAHEAVRLIVGESVVSNEEAASSGYRLGLKLTAKGVNLYVLYPSLCKSGSAGDLSSGHDDAGGGASDDGDELRPVIPGESVDGYAPFAADIYSEILVDWWRTGRVPRFTFDAQGIPVLVRMPSSPAGAKRASKNHEGGNEQSQDAGTMLPALRLRFSAPQGISANLCEAEYTILYLTVTENFLERPDIEFTDIVAGLRTPIFPYRSPIPPLSLSSAPVPPNYRILFTVPVLRSIISHGGDPTAESARLISSTLTDVAGRFDYGIDCRIIFELSANLAGVDDARVGAAAKGAPRTVIMPMLPAPSDGRGTFGSRPAAAEPSGPAPSAADNIASQAKTVSVSYDRPFGYRSNIMVAVSELRIIVVPELFRDLGLLTPPGLPYLVSTAPPPKARFNGRHVILTLSRPEVWLRADQGPADQRALVLRGDVVVAKLEWAPVTMLISVDVVARAIRIGLTNVGVPEQAVPSGPGPWSGSSSSYPLTAVVSPPAAFGHSRDNAGASASGSNLTERETPLLYPSDISVEFNVSHDASPSPPADAAAAPNGAAAATAAEAAASQPGAAPPTPTRSLTVTAESLLCRLDVHDTPLLLAVFSCFGRMSPTLLKLRPAEVELREAARLRALAAGGGGHPPSRQSFHLASEDDGLDGADGYDDEAVSSSGSDGEEAAVEDAVVPLPERLLSVFFSMPHARLLFTDETSGRYVPILEVRFRQTIANASVPWMASISSTIAVDLFSEARGVWEAGVEPFALHAAFSHGASGSRAVVVRVAGRLDVNVSPTTVHGAARVATAISSAIQELRPSEPGPSSPSSAGASPAPGILVPGTAAPSTPPGQPVASSQRPAAAPRGGMPLIRSVSAGGVSSAASSLRRPSVAAFCIRNDTGRPLVIWLPYDSTRRSLGSGREREVDVPTDELLLRAAAAAGRFDDADRARREALRCILALPGFEPVDVSAADVGIRTITLFPEQALSGHPPSLAGATDDGAGAGMSSQAGPAATSIVIAWDVQMRDGVPIGTVRSVMRIINRTRTLLEVAIGAPPALSRYNYLPAQANDGAGGDGRPSMSYSGGGGGGEQHLIRPDSSWAVPIYAVDRPLRIRPAIFHAPDSVDDDAYGRSPQHSRGSSNGLPGDVARSGVGVLYSYEWSDPLLSVANQCSLASRIPLYDTDFNRHARKSALPAPVAGARKTAGSTLPDGPRWQSISPPGVAEWHSRGVPAAAPPSSAPKCPSPISPVLACRAAIHGPAFHLAVHPSLCRQKPRRASPARYASSSGGPLAATGTECVDVSLRAPLLVDNTLPRSVSYKLAPVSSSGRAGAAVAATASALVQPLRTEHIHAVGRDISAFALALGYDNRPVAVVRASGAAASAPEQRASAAGSAALDARSEWSQCASGYRLTLYSEFWVRNRSDTPVLLRERSSANDVVGTGGTTGLRARPPGVPADSYVCFSSGWISLRRADVVPATQGGGSAETLTAAGYPWFSVAEELSDVVKPVQLFLGRGASVSVDVRPAGGRFGRTLIVTIRNVAWLNNATNSAIQWCQPTTLTSRGIALSSMVHTLAVGETQALHWDVKESHSASREICLRFVDAESGTSDWIWSRPIPVLAAKRGGGIAGDVAAKMYRPKRHEQYIARVSRSLLADGSPVVRVLREDRSSPPYRVVNACASRSIAFRQAGVNETHPWLVRPGKSTRYAWDDPHAPRKRRLLIVETIEHVDEDAPSSSSVASSERSAREPRALAGSSSSSSRPSRAAPPAGVPDPSPLAAADDRGSGGSASRPKGRPRRSGGGNVRDVHRPKFELSIDMVTADAGEQCRTPRSFDPPMCISVAVQGPTKVVTFSDAKPRAARRPSGGRGQERRASSSAPTSSLASSVPRPAQVPATLSKRPRAGQVQAVGDAGIPTMDLASLLGEAPDARDAPATSEPAAYPSMSSVTAGEDGAGSQSSPPGGAPPAAASRDADAATRSERAAASTDIEVWLEGVGISFVDDTPMEIAYLSATSLRVHIDTQPGSELAILQVADLQLDNQLPNAPWPVLLWAPPPPPASPFDSSSASVPGANVLPANAHKPVLHIALDRFVFSGDDAKVAAATGGPQRQQRVAMVKGAFAALQHLQLSLDEEFLLRAWMFMKSLKSVPGTEDDEDLSLEDGDHVGLAVSAVGADSPGGDAGGDGVLSWKRGPLYVERLLLCPIQLTVSLATARGTASIRGAGSGYRSMLRVLLSAAGNVDRAELRFRALELHHALDTGPHFGHLVGEYYLAQLDAQKMALLSSSALVGNPSALFDSIAVGARDFFVEPARANGAADFIAGLGRGSSSLLTNTVGGLVGSLGGIPSAVALGLETAVGDRDYLAERESIRGRRGATSTPAQGLFTGALSFGHGLASGAAGLIREPVAGAMAGGPVGFLRGIGRGVVGGLVKPLAGALDLIGEPAAGFRAFISTERNRRAAEPVRPRRSFAPGPALRLVAFDLRPALGDALLRALTREAGGEEEADAAAATPGAPGGLSETVVDWVDLSGDEPSARGGPRERERLLEIWSVLRRCAFGGARDRGGGGGGGVGGSGGGGGDGGGGAPSSLAAAAKTENEVLAAQWLSVHAHDRVALITSRRFVVGTLHGRTEIARPLGGLVDAHVPAAAGADYVLLGVRPSGGGGGGWGGDPSRPAAAEWQRLPCGSVAARNALHGAVRAAIGADGGVDAALTPRSARRAATAARRRQRDGSMEMVAFGSDAAAARRMPSL